MRLALKVDVDTLRGTLEGVPNLLRTLDHHGLNATFLFSLGPDHTGRALRRIFRRGFLGKVMRTSVGANYGLKTLCYGTLLPGPDIGRKASHILRAARDGGFDLGIHCYDHVRWQDYVATKGEEWTRHEITLAAERFTEIFGVPARTHGAAGWQMNDHAFRMEEEFKFAYCSDTRGTHPFLPFVAGKPVVCPQIPTTLPTLDELIGVDGITEDNVVDQILRRSEQSGPYGHVYTLHAELEGMRFLPVFESLLSGWRERGYQINSLGELSRSLDVSSLPVHRVIAGEIEGRTGMLAVQGEKVSFPDLRSAELQKSHDA
ncbi:MAG: polysaccharide deacetylase family protein [Nitrospirota bacterium]|nr:polysaccharide deacetylase family protein [Nitrospirota bacterium]